MQDAKVNEKLDPIRVALWEEYKEAVENFGYGKEAKEVLIKIDNIYNLILNE